MSRCHPILLMLEIATAISLSLHSCIGMLTFAGLYLPTTSCTFCCGAMLEAMTLAAAFWLRSGNNAGTRAKITSKVLQNHSSWGLQDDDFGSVGSPKFLK